MYSNARTLISTNERGFIKVLAESKTGKILGAQMLCERAGDMVTEFSMAIDSGMTVSDMIASIRPHPSFSEAIDGVLHILEKKVV